MAITVVAFGGPHEERRRLLIDIEVSHDLIIHAQGDTLDELRAYYATRPAMVAVLGARHLRSRAGDQAQPTPTRFWAAVDWLRASHPGVHVIVWALAIEPAAVDDLQAAGVRGILWAEDPMVGGSALVVRVVMGGAVVISRPASAYSGWTTESRPPYHSSADMG